MYGQVVVGPPGSGKTTFCDGMQQYLQLLGREAKVINLDPANEGYRINVEADESGSENQTSSTRIGLPYETLFDVCQDIVNIHSVMKETGLGPNGGLVYCMEYLENHIDTVIEKVGALLHDGMYLLLDLPGQVELYTHSTCVQKLIERMVKAFDLRLTAVQLIDAHYCTDASKFLSASLLGTTTMIRLELPMINVLSKIDLLEKYGELPMSFDFFTDCHDLDRLVPFLDNMQNANNEGGEYEDLSYVDDPDYQKALQRRKRSTFYKKYHKLHESIAEVVSDFGLLSFVPLDITKADSVGRVLKHIDKCNGYVFLDKNNVSADMFDCAIQHDEIDNGVADVQERIGAFERIEELQR